MILEIITGLVIAALVGVFVIVWRRASRAVGERHPVSVSAERIVGDKWSLAFAGDLPSVALEIEGGEHTGGEVYAWLTSHGAVDVGETRLRVTLRGLAEETVVVRSLRAVTERTPPFSGTLVHCPTAGANAATLLVFDLDEETPKAWQWREDGGRERVGSRPFFEHNSVTLARGEVHDFVIVGSAKEFLVRWRLEADLEAGRHREVVTVDDAGKPFVTSGAPDGGYSTTLDWAWYDGRRFLPPPSYDWSKLGPPGQDRCCATRLPGRHTRLAVNYGACGSVSAMA